MTRGADRLPVSDHAVLRYLQRVCGVDIDQVRRAIHADNLTALEKRATGTVINGIVYRIRRGSVTSCFLGEPFSVRAQHQAAAKKILRRSKDVPLLPED